MIAALGAGYVTGLRADNAALAVERDRLRADLNACAARYSAIIRDRIRDDEVDSLSDDDLLHVPDSSLRGAPY